LRLHLKIAEDAFQDEITKQSALHVEAKAGHSKVLQLLINAKANVNALTEVMKT
jgi:hypothetical protein